MKINSAITIKGAVQGIGFRPFIYRLANELCLKGFVNNSSAGVYIEAEGDDKNIYEFVKRIKNDKPHFSVISDFAFSFKRLKNYDTFEITESSFNGEPEALIIPDMAICDDCLKELFTPSDRRYLYPFINCTYCGPRYSIIKNLPYDRRNTTMDKFEMCPDCLNEYENPTDRRFHAQSNCCPVCGPSIQLLNKSGEVICENNNVIETASSLISSGNIIAFKSIGGFQLIADASNDKTVTLLRERKNRDKKPFALMFPTMVMIKNFCEVSLREEKLLSSPESPIVLLKKKDKDTFASSAPANPYLGVMLPYTPLHHLLLNRFGSPVVATSGNISDEPMCIDENEALKKLNGIADYFLVHNRKILRPIDDSVARIIDDKVTLLRRAKGYAPFPFFTDVDEEDKFIAVGAHLKNTVAFKYKKNIFISQHIGDLSAEESCNNFISTIEDFKTIYGNSEKVISDYHPDYFSSRYALRNHNSILVQHHAAHAASCYAENKLTGNVLAVIWDGTGLGFDKTIWGGEFFIYDGKRFQQAAQLKQFVLPGGDAAAKSPKHSATGVLFQTFNKDELKILQDVIPAYDEIDFLFEVIEKEINCVQTSSAGRLFDAVSFLLKLCSSVTYEGEAAMMLEYEADKSISETYPFQMVENKILIFDWREMIKEIIKDLSDGLTPSFISVKFHNTLINIILEAAKHFGKQNVVLSGGCFQNVLLLEGAIKTLRENNFIPYFNMLVPSNDGGISFGQIYYALNKNEFQTETE